MNFDPEIAPLYTAPNNDLYLIHPDKPPDSIKIGEMTITAEPTLRGTNSLIYVESLKMKTASDKFADLQRASRPNYNHVDTFATNTTGDTFKMENVAAGRKLMQSLPLIEMKEIVGMQPSQVMDLANKKFAQWEPTYPKMPTIYIYENNLGETMYQLEAHHSGAAWKLIAKIEHYTITDLPQEKPVPKPIEVFEDAFDKFKDTMLELLNDMVHPV